MIRTKEPQDIDKENRITGVVYLKACNRRETDTTVTFDVVYSILDINYRHEIVNVPSALKNELGGDIMIPKKALVGHPYIREYKTKQAVYKRNTFYSRVGNPTPEQYDLFFISQIEFINSQEWNGDELSKIYFWHLTANDLEVVTDEIYAQITTPFIEQIID